jgi:lanthanide-dependent methanol dehydrogenase
VLDATRYVHTTAVKDVDRSTGQPIRDLKHMPGYEKAGRGICPAVAGAKNREPTAFSPRTGYLYIPANNICMDVEGTEVNHIAGTPYLGANVKMYAGPGGFLGEMIAWDPVARKRVWSQTERFVTWGGALVTGGDLLFYGTMDRHFKALDARTGRALWQFETKTGIIAPPISYRGPDGRQYVAVLSGPGGWAGSVVSARLDPRDQTGARGFSNAMADLPAHTGRGGHLYVFRLP